MVDITVAYDALSKDADTWDRVADGLAAASAAASSIHTYRGAFSWAATGLADQYAAMRDQVIAMLAAGADTEHALATTLRTIRADFEDTEHEIIADLGQLWQSKY